ncbi:hypothetical protein B0H14DRAFT_2567678 [Mycena olivaceomarginata]|nr:hypothetical protein B0H14DRAFT_2567678 [Mycena olivaceomarginata]
MVNRRSGPSCCIATVVWPASPLRVKLPVPSSFSFPYSNIVQRQSLTLAAQATALRRDIDAYTVNVDCKPLFTVLAELAELHNPGSFESAPPSSLRLILRKFVTPYKFSIFEDFQFLAANLRQFSISVTLMRSLVLKFEQLTILKQDMPSLRSGLFKLRHSQPLIASMPGDPLARLSTPAVKSLIWDQAALPVSPRPAAWHHQ